MPGSPDPQYELQKHAQSFNFTALQLQVTGFYPRYGKRIFDITLVVVMIITLSWFFVLILIAYLVSFNFPVLFIQQRLGKNQAIFKMIKLRTLSVKHELPLHARRFWLGDFLRATNLDELPQIWNVLTGEMSFIGPRPLPVEYQTKFSVEQQTRHNVLPGITGLAQISGKNTIPWAQKLKRDVEYVNRISFKLDCLILLKTVTLVLSMKRDVSLNEQKFSG